MIKPEIVKLLQTRIQGRLPRHGHCMQNCSCKVQKWSGWMLSLASWFDEKSVYWKIVSYVQ